MKYFNINPLYTIIDIGTTKIIVIIAEKINNQLSLLGIGISHSHGLEKGVVVDIQKTTESVKKALEEAIFQAHVKPESVIIGISGHHIHSYFSLGMIPIGKEGVTQKIIDEALLAAQSIILPDDEKIIHSIPVSYIIDGTCMVKNPFGMHGLRLEVNSHIITANKNAIEDLISCCQSLGLKVKDIVLEPIASAEAILNEEEKNFGSLIIDIGGGTSDIALYKNGSLEFVEIVSIGGVLFTNDLAICLHIKKEGAEKIKKECGLIRPENHHNALNVLSLDMETPKNIDVEIINHILLARTEELIMYIIKVIDKYNHAYDIPSGIILTGGGALLRGLPDMISKYTGITCRVGYPRIAHDDYNLLKNPAYATAYGLLLYQIKYDNRFTYNNNSILYKLKQWMSKYID